MAEEIDTTTNIYTVRVEVWSNDDMVSVDHEIVVSNTQVTK